jgi:hypothetical protein
VRLGVTAGRRERRIGSTNANRDIARRLPVIDTDGVDRHVLDAQIAGLAIEKKYARRIRKRAQLGRLADASWADD